MQLTKNQVIILEDLLITNKMMFFAYRQIEEGNCEDTLFNLIFPLIRREKSLLSKLNLNALNESLIEDWILEQIGELPDSTLLLSTNETLNMNTYPYYRLLARIRYMTIDTKKGSQRFDQNFIDSESLLLYNGLMKSQENYQCIESELRHQAYMALLDSPEAELRIVLNGFRPVNRIDDYIDFASEMSVLETMLLNYETVKQYKHISISKSSDKLRARENRFFQRFPLLISKLNDIVSSAGSVYDLKNSVEFVTNFEYLKSIIAFSKKKNRFAIYKALKENLYFSEDSECFEYFMECLEESFSEIEDDICSRIVHYTLCPKGNLHGKD